MGDGTFTLVNQSGNTDGGNVITVYTASDTVMQQIEYDTAGINGGALSYVYIDGMEADKAQVSDAQSSLTLQGDAPTEGTHKVELVQFENDDPSGTVTVYKTASYEVKLK